MKREHKKKINELIKTFNEGLSAEVERLYNSGGIDPADYEDDYILPKIILTAALYHRKDDFRPLYEPHTSAFKNLLNF